MLIGHYDYFAIDPYQLVVLPQVRKTKNSRIDELADSIEADGLINPPDVARLTYDELKNHIDFINQLWKKNIDINSFKHLIIDGYYYVLIAGHTRVKSVIRNAEKNDRQDTVEVKIHKAKTSEEIFAIQLGENIHKEISVEERAVAIIGIYNIGIRSGKWHDKNEFVAEFTQNKKKLSEDIINDALAFANLTPEVQEYVFSNNISYAVGVQLGRMYPLVEKFEAAVSGLELPSEDNIKMRYATILTELKRAKSIKQSLAIIVGKINLMNDYFRPKDAVQMEMINFWNDGANRQGEEHKKQLKKEYNIALRTLTSMPYDSLIDFLGKNMSLTGEDHTLDIQSIKVLHGKYLQDRFLGF